jgi:hypothetical protein
MENVDVPMRADVILIPGVTAIGVRVQKVKAEMVAHMILLVPGVTVVGPWTEKVKRVVIAHTVLIPGVTGIVLESVARVLTCTSLVMIVLPITLVIGLTAPCSLRCCG